MNIRLGEKLPALLPTGEFAEVMVTEQMGPDKFTVVTRNVYKIKGIETNLFTAEVRPVLVITKIR